jgi:Ca2+/Na+ antiporter
MKMGEEGNKRGLFGKIIYFLIDIPFDLLRDISIPPFELKKWNKFKFSILPLGLSLFLTVSFELYDLYINYPIIVIIYYIFILVICILFYVNSYRGKLPNCTWGLLSTAFIMSIIWIWTVTNILMDMIQAIQMLIPIQLPEVFLTMTVLALGNSLPDFIVNCSLAKNGYGEMALSGCIGAPVFGLTFGFGISLLKRILVLNDISEGLELNLWNTNDIQSQRIIFAAFCNILCTIFILLVFGYKLKFKLKKIVGYICYFIYTCYFVALVYFSFFNQNSKK